MKKVLVMLRWGLIAFALLELLLRLFGAPRAYVHYGTIRRPCQCRDWVIEGGAPGMDARVRHCTNELGLRGRMPRDDEQRILAIGNSTTECTFLDDPRTWPALLDSLLGAQGASAWVGNAGVNGVTTRGNLAMLQEMTPVIKPGLVILLPGANDRGPLRAEQDTGLFAPASLDFFQWAAEHSRIAASLLRLYRSSSPMHVRWKDDPSRPTVIEDQDALLEAYRQRLTRFIETCGDQKVKLLLVTQPLTAALGTAEHEEMERYNDVVRQLTSMMNVALFDLSRDLPKDPTLYLDGLHFSNAGAREVAARMVTEVAGVLSRD